MKTQSEVIYSMDMSDNVRSIGNSKDGAVVISWLQTWDDTGGR